MATAHKDLTSSPQVPKSRPPWLVMAAKGRADKAERSPFLDAAVAGDTFGMSKSWPADHDKAVDEEGRSALHLSAVHGHLEGTCAVVSLMTPPPSRSCCRDAWLSRLALLTGGCGCCRRLSPTLCTPVPFPLMPLDPACVGMHCRRPRV
jgi:hypothetical protein